MKTEFARAAIGDAMPDFEEFYKHYERAKVDPLTIGLTAIDPPEKHGAENVDHEELDNLLGGDVRGHYHLTKAQLDELIRLTGENYPPRITPSQIVIIDAGEEMTPYRILGENVRI